MDEGKLSLESKDIAAEKRQELLRLFPEAQTEGGKIDFDQLKRVLGESIDVGRERYGMTWPGKADCFRLIQSPSTATLLPFREESVRFDETENMIIEGDNLEVLKLLQKGYQNKVKMIYIDPPYNTGNDFIYPDDYTDTLKNYLQYTGQVDREGKSFSNNLKTEGRFHTKWLSFMYPRLYLARNLMSDDGIIFVSINDKELGNLRALLDSVFGEDNFITTFIWVNEGNLDNASKIKDNHEYVICYAKSEPCFKPSAVIDPNIDQSSKLFREHIENTLVKNGPANPQSPITLPEGFPADFERGIIEVKENFWPKFDREAQVENWKLKQPVTVESGWSSKELILQFIKGQFAPIADTKGQHTEMFLAKSGALMARKKRQDNQSHVLSVLRGMGTVQGASSALAEVGIDFSYPKPVELLEYLIKVGTSEESLVLDFFAGSGTLGQAVINLNRTSGRRKFICVQLPERIVDASSTIADIAKKRLRAVSEDARYARPGGTLPGFKVFKESASNFKVWSAHTDDGSEGVERQMELAVNHIMPDRTAEDLFYEILMKSEYPLTAKIENFDAAGIPAFSVEEDALIVCVERKVTAEAVAAITKRSPSKVIFLDEAFSGNDQLKANAKMNFESAGVKRFETV